MIIFLDIDGVLNDHKKINDVCDCNGLKLSCVEQFNRIIYFLKPKIVISSAWRYMILNNEISRSGFKYLLQTHGVTKNINIIGVTDFDREDLGKNRGELIDNFIKKFHINEHFIILDDSPGDMCFNPHQDKLYKTDGNIGLTKNDADTIISNNSNYL